MRKIIIIVSMLIYSTLSNAQSKSKLTHKNYKELLSWHQESPTLYSLNDDRLSDDANPTKYIGAYKDNVGQVFFIDNKEVLFKDSNNKVINNKNIYTRTLLSGSYRIVIIWDKNMNEGANWNGQIFLYVNNQLQEKSKIYFNGY